MRGTANESAVLAALAKKPFVVAAFERGMLVRKDADWLACSVDAVALIDARELGMSNTSQPELATVEIKTNLAASSLDRAVSRASMDVKTCEGGDAEFRNLVPREHCGQVLQQAIVLCAQYAVYVCAGETGNFFAAVNKAPRFLARQCLLAIRLGAEPAVSWAHDSNINVPAFADSASSRVIQQPLTFWRMLNAHVKERGVLPLTFQACI